MAHSSAGRAWARGGTIFGATVLMVIGVFQLLIGIAAILRDQFLVVTPNYLYEFDSTTWGLIHLGVGALAVVAGAFVLTGAAWARAIGIALAAASAIANFFFLPFYPLWSLLIIAAAIWVIWSLATTPARGRHALEPGAGMAAAPAGSEPERWARINVPGATERVERFDRQARTSERMPPAAPAEEEPALERQESPERQELQERQEPPERQPSPERQESAPERQG